MDLLTVPSASRDGADLMVKQVEVSRRLYQPPLATAKALVIPQRQTGARWRERETHGVMPNPRQASHPSSEGRQLSPSMKVRFAKVLRR